MECVSIFDLLNIQSIPLSEKQFWAISYSLLMLWNKSLSRNGYNFTMQPCFHSKNSADIQSYHFNITTKERSFDEQESQTLLNVETCSDPSVYPNLSNVIICENGCVFLSSSNSKKSDAIDARIWLQEYGYLLFLCLDFGLPQDQERSLSKEVNDFISFLTESTNLVPAQGILSCFLTSSQVCRNFDPKSIISDMVKNIHNLQQHLDVLQRLGVERKRQQHLGDRSSSSAIYSISHESVALWRKVNEEFLNFDRQALRPVPQVPRRSFEDTSLHGRLMTDIRRGNFNLRPALRERAMSENVDESTWGLLMKAVRKFSRHS